MTGLDLGLGLTRHTPLAGSPAVTPLTMVDAAFTTAADLGDGEWRVTKTSGGNSWDGSAVSAAAVAGDFILRLIPEFTDEAAVIGLSANPTANNNYDGLDVALMFNNGAVSAGASGAFSALGESYVANDVWFLKRTGTTISFGTGGADGVTGYVEKASFTKAGDLYVDSCLYYALGAGAATPSRFKIKRLA